MLPARGRDAHDVLAITGDISRYTRAKCLQPGTRHERCLRDTFTVLVHQLVYKLVILQQQAARAGRNRILVAGNMGRLDLAMGHLLD